jgi:phage recombination protein Bet
MTNDSALITTDLTPDAMVVYERLTPLKDALGLDKLTVPEMQLFAMVAAHTGLDPFTRQIYAIKRGGKVTHQTGIDGYRSSAERTQQYRGTGPAEFELCDCGDEGSPREHPRVARVEVYRAYPEGIRAQIGEARWHELKPEHRKPQNAYEYLDAMWWQMPFNQLAKCAEANGLRKAFPRVLGNVYIAEEMDQARVIEPPPPARPTLAERAAAAQAAQEPPLLSEPMPPEVSAIVNAEEVAELSASALAALARSAGKTKGQIAQAIAMIRPGMAVPGPAEVTEIVTAMTDAERRLLAVELNLDAGGAS